MDLLINLVKTSIEENFHPEFSLRDGFLDSKYVSAVARLYPRFSKTKRKESFRFPKGLLQSFASIPLSNLGPRRYYFSFNVCKRHWVGVCVDPSCGKITVLDCNTPKFSDATIEKQLYPHLAMIPYLVRHPCQPNGCDGPLPFEIDRPKGVSQSPHPFQSGLRAVLLMATHAVYGIEACKNMNESMVDEEGKSAALMDFQLRESI